MHVHLIQIVKGDGPGKLTFFALSPIERRYPPLLVASIWNPDLEVVVSRPQGGVVVKRLTHVTIESKRITNRCYWWFKFLKPKNLSTCSFVMFFEGSFSACFSTIPRKSKKIKLWPLSSRESFQSNLKTGTKLLGWLDWPMGNEDLRYFMTRWHGLRTFGRRV